MEKLKRKSDWAGRFVKLKRKLENGGGRIFPADLIMQVAKNRGGLSLETVEYCESCGIGR